MDMRPFKEILAKLPSIEHIARLELLDTHGTTVDSIVNEPGKQGSLAVYHQVSLQHDLLDAQAARAALTLFAEHVADAQQYPGKHPNIDRLFTIIDQHLHYRIRIIHADHS